MGPWASFDYKNGSMGQKSLGTTAVNGQCCLQTWKGFKLNDVDLCKKVEELKDTFSLRELKSVINLLGVKLSPRQDVASELCKFLNNISLLFEATNEEQLDEEEDEHVEEVSENSSCSKYVQQSRPFQFSSSDTEESLRLFTGEDNYTINLWLTDFEELAQVMRCYSALKEALVEEFSRKINSAELHRTLSKRTMQEGESLHQYVLIMKELAARGDIDVESLIQYIIDGIPDPLPNKLHLYEVQDLKELKRKLMIYERVRPKCDYEGRVKEKPLRLIKTDSDLKVETRKCFNCYEEGHLVAECPKPRREKGSCFECGKMGHLQRDCERQKQSTSSLVSLVAEKSSIPPYTADILIEGATTSGEVEALSGSAISLIMEDRVSESDILRDVTPSDSSELILIDHSEVEIVNPELSVNEVKSVPKIVNKYIPNEKPSKPAVEIKVIPEQNLSILQESDKGISEGYEYLEDKVHKRFELCNGLVYRKKKGKILFVVPEKIESQIVSKCHDYVGHLGVNKGAELILWSYWLLKLQDKINYYIANCIKCIAYILILGKKKGELLVDDVDEFDYNDNYKNDMDAVWARKRAEHLEGFAVWK
uniref:RNA-directed DNA polymerase n=1 Tax=Rhodnius prolixus TaxID=13249 RepID=T1IFE3_RHOPR